MRKVWGCDMTFGDVLSADISTGALRVRRKDIITYTEPHILVVDMINCIIYTPYEVTARGQNSNSCTACRGHNY